MNAQERATARALAVLVMHPKVQQALREGDPKAWEQATAALKPYGWPNAMLSLNEQAESAPDLSYFTVVGLYEETGERFCDYIAAEDAAGAEVIAETLHPSVTIAGVFAGKLEAKG